MTSYTKPQHTEHNYSSRLDVCLQNPSLGYRMFVTNEELDNHYTQELNLLLNMRQRGGEVYTTKMVEECMRMVLSQMVMSGMFTK
jgi:hypothetical protein